MRKKMIRIGSMILAVIIMLCPLSVCFAAEETIVSLVGEEIIKILWESLKAWGIQIIETGYEDMTNNVRQWLTGQLYEYLNDELHEAFDYWITGMQFYRDAFGRLIGNDDYIKAADQFADHLRQAFGITNNAIIAIEATYTIGDLDVFTFPLYGFAKNSRGEGQAIVKLENTNGTLYAIPYHKNDFSDAFIVLGTSNYTYAITANYIDNDGYIFGSSGTLTTNSNVGSYWYIADPVPSTFNSANQYIIIDGAQGNRDSVYYELSTHVTIEQEGLVIDSGNIILPSYDPNYSDGYSMIFYPDGSIAYLDIIWPETITVDNLPAIVSTGRIRTLDLVSVFAPIKAFANTFADGFDIMVQIVYNMPTEIVSIALTIMAVIAVFGTIKIFKEH